MAWAIITIYTSICAQVDSQQLPKTSKFYSKSKKCDIEKTLGGGYQHPLVARRLIMQVNLRFYQFNFWGRSHDRCREGFDPLKVVRGDQLIDPRNHNMPFEM